MDLTATKIFLSCEDGSRVPSGSGCVNGTKSHVLGGEKPLNRKVGEGHATIEKKIAFFAQAQFPLQALRPFFATFAVKGLTSPPSFTRILNRKFRREDESVHSARDIGFAIPVLISVRTL